MHCSLNIISVDPPDFKFICLLCVQARLAIQISSKVNEEREVPSASRSPHKLRHDFLNYFPRNIPPSLILEVHLHSSNFWLVTRPVLLKVVLFNKRVLNFWTPQHPRKTLPNKRIQWIAITVAKGLKYMPI